MTNPVNCETLFIVLCAFSLVKSSASSFGAFNVVQRADRRLKEVNCQLEEPNLNFEKAMLGRKRRKRATVVLSTEMASGQGLTNQHMTFVSLLTLGIALEVDRIILPNHKYRSHFSIGATWQDTNAATIWDVESIKTFLQARGIDIQAGISFFVDHKMQWCTSYPSLNLPLTAPLVDRWIHWKAMRLLLSTVGGTTISMI